MTIFFHNGASINVLFENNETWHCWNWN